MEVTSVTIDTSATGTHEVVYKVIDPNNGVLASATRTIIVEQPTLGTLEPSEGDLGTPAQSAGDPVLNPGNGTTTDPIGDTASSTTTN